MTDKKIKKRKVAKEIYPTPLDMEYLTPMGLCRWLRERSKAVGMKPASNYTRKVREWIDAGSLQTQDVRVVETIEKKSVFSRTRRAGQQKRTSKQEEYDCAKHGDWNGDTKKVGRGSTVIEIIQTTEERIYRKDWIRFVVEHMDWLIPERQEDVFKKVAGLINEEEDPIREYVMSDRKRRSDWGRNGGKIAKKRIKYGPEIIQEGRHLIEIGEAANPSHAAQTLKKRYPELDINVDSLRQKI